MKVYINGVGNISPQNTFDNGSFLETIVDNESDNLRCVEPVYKTLIPARKLRRMSRIIKMGVFAANVCLKQANWEQLDAIITGTGLGCIEDTEKFLTTIFQSEEGIVSPTQFIQSTHNSISSQIALMMSCNSYNFTYVHRGFSFESALLDAMLLLKENDNKRILIGGLDEITESYLSITKRLRQWKPNTFKQLNLLEHHSRGSIPGEGAAFFAISNEIQDSTYAEISGLKMIYKPKSTAEVSTEIQRFLASVDLTIADVDLTLLGLSGNSVIDNVYYELKETLLKNANLAYFKHLCGEYKTATSFALWLAAAIVHHQYLPPVIKLGDYETGKLKNILIYNNYSNINHSLLLVRYVES